MKNNKDHHKDVVDAVDEGAQEQAHPAADSAGKVPAEVEALLAQVAQWKDTAMRAQAEFDNTKKRLAQQQQTALARAGERVATALIPVMDDLEYGIVHARDTENDMLNGLQAIQAKLAAVLADEGIEIIDPVGQPFDHDTAQAVQVVSDLSQPDQTVVQVLQKGYVMAGASSSESKRVLRPAMVVVSSNG